MFAKGWFKSVKPSPSLEFDWEIQWLKAGSVLTPVCQTKACLQAQGHPMSACTQPVTLPMPTSEKEQWFLRLHQSILSAGLLGTSMSPRSEGPDPTLAGNWNKSTTALCLCQHTSHNLCYDERNLTVTYNISTYQQKSDPKLARGSGEIRTQAHTIHSQALTEQSQQPIVHRH